MLSTKYRCRVCCLAAAFFLAFSYHAHAVTIISINIDGDTDHDLAAADVVGVVEATNWNNVGAVGSGTNRNYTNLMDNTGTVTTTDVGLGGSANLYNNNTAIDGSTITAPYLDDAKMMGSSRGESQNGLNRSVEVKQLNLALYDVYVYFGGVNTDASTPYVLNIKLQTFDGSAYVDASPVYYMRDSNRTWDGTYNQSTATTAADAVDGQEYVLFQNVTGTQFKILSEAVNRRAGISGVQIVEVVPEPGTEVVVLASLAGFAGLARRRRHET